MEEEKVQTESKESKQENESEAKLTLPVSASSVVAINPYTDKFQNCAAKVKK